MEFDGDSWVRLDGIHHIRMERRKVGDEPSFVVYHVYAKNWWFILNEIDGLRLLCLVSVITPSPQHGLQQNPYKRGLVHSLGRMLVSVRLLFHFCGTHSRGLAGPQEPIRSPLLPVPPYHFETVGSGSI